MKSLFDPQPKSDPKYLYSREIELNNIVRYIKENKWVILLGPRRVGKTSISRCAAAELKNQSIVVDARVDKDFVKGLFNSLASSTSISLHGSAAIPYTPFTLNADYTKTHLTQTLDQLLSSIKKLLIILDEAQWLKNPRGVAMLMAHIFDYHYERVTFIITGSAVGVMKSIIEPTARSALYGRAMTTMEISKWRDPSTSLNFLKEGCRQKSIDFEEDELVRVVENLDGIPGWLTLFGYHYSTTGNAEKAMENTKNEALKIVKDELESTAKLALGWQRQLKILTVISQKRMKFKQIAEELTLSDAALSRNLNMLTRLQYIEVDDEKNYAIIDPIVKEYLRRFLPAKNAF
jgi:AAA+ ATPase superfamily predicted ATPase